MRVLKDPEGSWWVQRVLMALIRLCKGPLKGAEDPWRVLKGPERPGGVLTDLEEYWRVWKGPEASWSGLKGHELFWWIPTDSKGPEWSVSDLKDLGWSWRVPKGSEGSWMVLVGPEVTMCHIVQHDIMLWVLYSELYLYQNFLNLLGFSPFQL